MISVMQQKIVPITPPGALVDNTSPATTSIDTRGFSWCTVIVQLGATDIAMAAFKLQQSDTDSGYVDITGADFSSGTCTDGTAASLPSASDDNHFFAIQVDLKGKKRYLDLVITGGDGAVGAYINAFAILSRAEQVPNSMSNRGFTQEIKV